MTTRSVKSKKPTISGDAVAAASAFATTFPPLIARDSEGIPTGSFLPVPPALAYRVLPAFIHAVGEKLSAENDDGREIPHMDDVWPLLCEVAATMAHQPDSWSEPLWRFESGYPYESYEKMPDPNKHELVEWFQYKKGNGCVNGRGNGDGVGEDESEETDDVHRVPKRGQKKRKTCDTSDDAAGAGSGSGSKSESSNGSGSGDQNACGSDTTGGTEPAQKKRKMKVVFGSVPVKPAEEVV